MFQVSQISLKQIIVDQEIHAFVEILPVILTYYLSYHVTRQRLSRKTGYTHIVRARIKYETN